VIVTTANHCPVVPRRPRRVVPRRVERRYADGTERVRAGLRAAAELREASGTEAARMESELAVREAALRRVLSVLDEA